jgi:hypothetical protein
MSGPVFVLDAQGRALMPLAEAHARKLLHTGRARRWPHPTLTIIQLNRVVEQPVLRPILLGVAIHQTAAQLFVLADGPQAAFPLLSLVVNFPRRWRVRSYCRSPRARTRRPIGQQTIVSVIGALWTLLPLSHVVLLRTPSLPAAHLSSLRRLRRLLAVDELRITIARLDGTVPAAFPPNLFALLQAVAANPASYAPLLAADVIRLPQHPARLTRRPHDADADIPASGIGIVTKPPLIGVIHHDSTEDERVLGVPVAASRAGVVWRYVALPRQTPLQRWPLSTVVLLPLVSRATQEAVQLWEDDLSAFEMFSGEGGDDAPREA